MLLQTTLQPPRPAAACVSSDFPHLPISRNKGAPLPATIQTPPPNPTSGKSWASLFNKTTISLPVQQETILALPGPSCPIADDSNSIIMSKYLSKYTLDHRQVPLIPRGLTNRSNNCYVNAVLQALIACPPFYNMLKALPHPTPQGQNCTPVIDSMIQLCYEYSRTQQSTPLRGQAALPGPTFLAGLPLETGTALRVLSALRPFGRFQEGRQEDAEEFLGCLLNSLNDEMLELIKFLEPEETKKANISQSQQNGAANQEQPLLEEDDHNEEWKAARRTPVADIFRGRTRMQLHKAAHAAQNDVTDNVQPFFTLHLDIERTNNVKDALELLANKDTLELEGASDAWQQLSLEQLPEVLVLHLKCFQVNSRGNTVKIVKNIDFPIDLKVDLKIMSSKAKYTPKQRLYKLFAVVYHEGFEAVRGHYLTDTYHGPAGWTRFDDSTVTQVTRAQVLKPKPPRTPYLLMYRRHDTLPRHSRNA